MPPLAGAIPMIAGMAAGGVANAVGTGLATSAANKGPQYINPAQAGQYLQLLSPLASSGAGTLSSMIATGNPTNVGPAWQALVNAQQPLKTFGLQEMLGQFAGSGLRYSSDALNAASQYESQTNADFLSILANYTMQSSEAAAGRQLSASEFALQSFAQPALAMTTPQQSVAGNVLQAAGGTAGNDLMTLALLQQLGISGKGAGQV